MLGNVARDSSIENLLLQITNGKVWPLINCLCFFTAILSSFLDNVTTVLLMTPVTIRLCEVMELNPVPILMSMVIYSNIGGALTPVGDPPNVIIASNSHISKNVRILEVFSASNMMNFEFTGRQLHNFHAAYGDRSLHGDGANLLPASLQVPKHQ